MPYKLCGKELTLTLVTNTEYVLRKAPRIHFVQIKLLIFGTHATSRIQLKLLDLETNVSRIP